MSNSLKMSDGVVAQLVQLLQLAIMTQTDITDHIRSMRMLVSGDSLVLEPQYVESYEKYIQQLVEEVNQKVVVNNCNGGEDKVGFKLA